MWHALWQPQTRSLGSMPVRYTISPQAKPLRVYTVSQQQVACLASSMPCSKRGCGGCRRRVVAESVGSCSEPLFEDIYHYYETAAAWTVPPGLHAALASIHQAGIKICVVSNFDERLRSILSVRPCCSMPQLAPLLVQHTLKSSHMFSMHQGAAQILVVQGVCDSVTLTQNPNHCWHTDSFNSSSDISFCPVSF